ncbi:MAG: AAA family ATPase, partial [Solirubrobacterales bacterium]|nr:AAA family ATPase [Solirubrobacterales bacterium]
MPRPLTDWWRRRSRAERAALLLAPLLTAVVAVLAVTQLRDDPAPKPPVSSFSGLLQRVADRKVQALDVDPGRLVATVDEKAAGVPDYEVGVPGAAGNEQLLAAARRAGVELRSVPQADDGDSLLYRLLGLIPALLIVAIVIVLWRTMRPGARSRRHTPADTDTRFEQVAGVGEAVQELADVREFLSDPGRFEQLGARVPKGVLLYGPPGTGKTLLAKAIATEARADFYSVAGSDFVEMFAGLGATRVRALFREAKKAGRPAIIFIDELDAVGKARSGGGGDGATREADQTLTQLLTEMDGFTASEHPVVVIGATNHVESLDAALLRPLANILNETVLEAARRHADLATNEDLENAFFRIVAGARKHNRALSDHERRVIAFHEAGHALAGERLAAADKVHKISIIPRGRSGGQTLLVSEEDVFLHSRQGLRDRLVWTLAGRAAEELVFGEVTSGAADDLQRATRLAWKMVAQLGMGDALGLRVADADHPLSPMLAADVDQETRRLLGEQYERALALLSELRPVLDRVAEALLV